MKFNLSNYFGMWNIKNFRPLIRNLTTSNVLRKKNVNKKLQITYPTLFQEKLNLIKNGLKDELHSIKFSISSENENNNDNEKKSLGRYQAFYNLKTNKISYDSLYGNVIELSDNKLIGLGSSVISKNKAFTLKQNDKSFITYVMDYKPTNGTILLKLVCSIEEWREFKTNSICDLLPSSKTYLDNVLEFILSSKFTDMPGWKTLDLIYKGSKSQIAYSDRKVKFSNTFNTTQEHAIKAALNSKRQILCIGGPPGTGKTSVIVEIIKQLLENGQKILVIVPRVNVLTNILERIDLKDYKICAMVGDEINNINKKLESHKEFSNLEYMANLICKIKNESVPSDQIKSYSGIVSNITTGIKKSIINESQIVFTSVGRNIMNLLPKAGFIPDVVLFEEGSQILECVAWRFILSGKRSIVVGDHNQLVTSLNSESAANKYQLGVSIMEYLWNNLFEVDKIMLNNQYRMNKNIMEWSSKIFYKNAMVADTSVENILLSDISKIKKGDMFNSPLLVFDSKSCFNNFKEKKVKKSWANDNEVLVCTKYVKFLLKNKLKETDIGIITAYNAQKDKIEEHLKDYNIKVSTVDGFQGQQKEVIIFCFVRNNKNKNIGFLSEKKRMNVAITRSKRQFVFIGNTDMLTTDDSFKELKNILLSKGVSVDAGQYLSYNKIV